MEHNFIKDKNYKRIDNHIARHFCLYCNVELFTWFRIKNGEFQKYQYAMLGSTQFWPPGKCSNSEVENSGITTTDMFIDEAKQLKLL